MRDISMMQL